MDAAFNTACVYRALYYPNTLQCRNKCFLHSIITMSHEKYFTILTSSEGTFSTFVCDPPALCIAQSFHLPFPGHFILTCFLSRKWPDYSAINGHTSKSWKSRRMAIWSIPFTPPDTVQPWAHTATLNKRTAASNYLDIYILWYQSPSGFAAASCDDRFVLCFPFLSLFLLLKEKKSMSIHTNV